MSVGCGIWAALEVNQASFLKRSLPAALPIPLFTSGQTERGTASQRQYNRAGARQPALAALKVALPVALTTVKDADSRDIATEPLVLEPLTVEETKHLLDLRLGKFNGVGDVLCGQLQLEDGVLEGRSGAEKAQNGGKCAGRGNVDSDAVLVLEEVRVLLHKCPTNNEGSSADSATKLSTLPDLVSVERVEAGTLVGSARVFPETNDSRWRRIAAPPKSRIVSSISGC